MFCIFTRPDDSVPWTLMLQGDDAEKILRVARLMVGPKFGLTVALETDTAYRGRSTATTLHVLVCSSKSPECPPEYREAATS